MEHRRLSIIVAAGALGALALVGCSAQEQPADTGAAPAASSSAGSMSPKPSASQGGKAAAAQPAAGGYIDYAAYDKDKAKYADSDVVLFFNASWCPTCQEAQGNLESASFPRGLTVVSVDYDNSDDLKQRYGVTYQHTFVQVDPSGKELAKFTGSTTVDQIAEQLA